MVSRRGRLLTHLLPVLVWFGALACVIGLFHRRSQRFEVLGVAQARTYQIAATCTGRLRSVPVQLFDHVNEGQPLAVVDTVLDNEDPNAELQTIKARIRQLEAEKTSTENRLRAEATNLENDRVADARAFATDVEAANQRKLELNAQIETDQISLQNLELDKKSLILGGGVQTNDLAFLERQRIEVQHNIITKRIEQNQARFKQAEEDLKQAKARRDAFESRRAQHQSIQSALDVIREQIQVENRRIDELEARRVPLVLKAPCEGLVSGILCREGEAVLPGGSVLTVVEGKPSEIVAYATEEQVSRIKTGQAVELIKGTEPEQIVRSRVVYIGPVVEQIPPRLWRNPNVPQWKRPVLIEMPDVEDFRLVPGELVGVRGL